MRKIEKIHQTNMKRIAELSKAIDYYVAEKHQVRYTYLTLLSNWRISPNEEEDDKYYNFVKKVYGTEIPLYLHYIHGFDTEEKEFFKNKLHLYSEYYMSTTEHIKESIEGQIKYLNKVIRDLTNLLEKLKEEDKPYEELLKGYYEIKNANNDKIVEDLYLKFNKKITKTRLRKIVKEEQKKELAEYIKKKLFPIVWKPDMDTYYKRLIDIWTEIQRDIEDLPITQYLYFLYNFFLANPKKYTLKSMSWTEFKECISEKDYVKILNKLSENDLEKLSIIYKEHLKEYDVTDYQDIGVLNPKW
jgi:hypothetical protein